MSLEIQILHIGDVEIDSSRIVWGHQPGIISRVPIYSYLIIGGEKTILVDTGFREPEIMTPRGCKGLQTEEQILLNQLKKHGVKPSDIDYLVHTHAHIDHAGRDEDFPDSIIVLQRKEMEATVSGLMGGQYNYLDVSYLLKRLHQKGSMWMLDGDIGGPTRLIPGVTCHFARAHTPGSQNIYVQTSKGVAVICGDVIYNTELQTRHYREINGDFWPSGNHFWTKRDEMAAIARVVQDADFILPIHDYGVMEKYGDRII